jgi:pantothenate kinase
MGRLVSFTIHDSGMEWKLLYKKQTVYAAFRPLARDLSRAYHGESVRPYCVALAGPPGCGKSAIAAVLRDMLANSGITSVVLPLDGFHLPNDTLKNRHVSRNGRTLSLYALKGAPETYATDSLHNRLIQLTEGKRFFWPMYSRVTHEPAERGLYIDNDRALYIVEGNYLLLQSEPWAGMQSCYHRTIFIESRETALKRRIISRKKRGGYSGMYARQQYNRSDRYNIRQVMESSGNWDYKLLHTGKYCYELESAQHRGRSV